MVWLDWWRQLVFGCLSPPANLGSKRADRMRSDRTWRHSQQELVRTYPWYHTDRHIDGWPPRRKSRSNHMGDTHYYTHHCTHHTHRTLWAGSTQAGTVAVVPRARLPQFSPPVAARSVAADGNGRPASYRTIAPKPTDCRTDTCGTSCRYTRGAASSSSSRASHPASIDRSRTALHPPDTGLAVHHHRPGAAEPCAEPHRVYCR